MSLSEDILRLVHAFPDAGRKNAIRRLALRAKNLEEHKERLRAVLTQCAIAGCVHAAEVLGANDH